MTKRGPKPQTTSQKKAKGERRPSRLDDDKVINFPAVDRAPDAPEHLNEYAKQRWDELAPLLYAQKILSVADLMMLEQLCSIYGEIRDMEDRRVEVPITLRNQLRLYAAEFGITPSSRTRVGKVGPEDKNAFSRNGAQNNPSRETTRGA